jgi:NAD(P)-dependent dehydrogenase (short-subunit alcohol dehydrogenase family)
MRERGGVIHNMSSVSGIVGGHNLVAYNAAKGAVRLLTKSVALHCARVCCTDRAVGIWGWLA